MKLWNRDLFLQKQEKKMEIVCFDTNDDIEKLKYKWQDFLKKQNLKNLYDDVLWKKQNLLHSIKYEQDAHFFLLASQKEYTSKELKNIQNIKKYLLERGKELHIITEYNDFSCQYIKDVLEQKYDAITIANQWLEQVGLISNANTTILVDCDRTLSDGADSTYLAFEYWKKNTADFGRIYKEGFFSTYQSVKAVNLLKKTDFFTEDCISSVLKTIKLNEPLITDLKSLQNVQILPITAGNSKLWKRILNDAGLNVTVPDTGMIMSEAIKYQVCRLLQEKGHFVLAIGDSPLDIPMLIKANKGYVISNKGNRDYIESMLKSHRHIHCLSYCSYQYPGIQSDISIETIKVLEYQANQDEIKQINKTKKAEGLSGKELRNVHQKIGTLFAKKIREDFPQSDFYVAIVLRSGLLVGLSIADYFDCPIVFCSMDREPHIISEPQNAELLKNRIPIMVDGVINTGATLTKADTLPLFQNKPYIVVTNVLSCGAKICPTMKLYTSRLSACHYSDRRYRETQVDTSDRLFLSSKLSTNLLKNE